MFRRGSINAERLEQMKRAGTLLPSLNSPLYYPDAEPTIFTSVTAMSADVVDLSKR